MRLLLLFLSRFFLGGLFLGYLFLGGLFLGYLFLLSGHLDSPPFQLFDGLGEMPRVTACSVSVQTL